MQESKPDKVITFRQTLNEEIANTITHSIGTGLSLAGSIILVVAAIAIGDIYRIVGVTIYGVSLILLYLASTMYHAVQRPEVRWSIRRALHVADHIAIFWLIAGTYTPILLILLRGRGGWTFLTIIWSIALVGSILKLFFTGRYKVLSTIAYVSMGWMAVFVVTPFIQMQAFGILIWVGLGGIFYTLGVIPFAWTRLPYNHAIWHLFVMGGSLCHFLGIWFHVLPAA